ncbi:MAG: acyl-CoA desaturase [Sphingobacteriales bacterium]|nr:MAG: acyl-CoA desaturase [Sphingobacteriales bacterium]
MSFVNSINADFSKELKREVDNYFKSSLKKQTGDWRIFHKTLVLFVALIILYVLLLFGTLPVWANVIMCVLMGFTFAFIGFNVMHDGGHGSYSDKKWLNEIMGHSLNVMGASTYFWKFKHNIVHHTYTNIEGHDDDIDIKPFIRTNKDQKRYFFHKFQHIYALFLYSITYLFWWAFNDFVKYFSGKILDKKIPEMKTKEHIGFWLTKVIYIAAFIVLPIIVVGWKNALIGYLIISGVTGMIISIVFQLAHVVEDVDFPTPDAETLKIEENWFVHQLQTTANFSTKSKFVSWMTGGLNFQVEHHLFPRISHVHYPAISRIVQQVCAKYNIPYHEYPTLAKAIGSHLGYLRVVGNED